MINPYENMDQDTLAAAHEAAEGRDDITKALFRYYFVDWQGNEVLVLEDMGGETQLGDDLPNVLRDMVRIHLQRNPDGGFAELNDRIIYGSRAGIYNGIHALPDGRFVSTYKIQTSDLENALNGARASI